MRIELLYFEGCPGYQLSLHTLKRILAEENIDSNVETICVESVEKAMEVGFLGSPSIRIDGRDVEEDARDLKDFGMKCRIYPASGMGVPPENFIREAIRDARRVSGKNDKEVSV
jgi:hypothetical protein